MLNKSKKFILYLVLLVNVFFSFAATTIQNAPVTKESDLSSVVMGGIFFGLLFGLFLAIIILVIWWIVRKIQEAKRKNSDLLFGKYLLDLAKTHQNKDSRLKKRNWKTCFLTYKRSSIYLQTKEEGLKEFGKYDGELIEKDNFFIIAIYKVTGIFTRERDLILIPYELRKIVKKELHSGNFEMLIDAESVTEALNTDYYGQLIFKNPKDNNKLIDFNDYIQQTYLTKFVDRQVLKDSLLTYADAIQKATELNPNIQTERKNPKL